MIGGATTNYLGNSLGLALSWDVPFVAPVQPPTPGNTNLNQLDQGLQYQRAKVYAGDTLGDLIMPITPAKIINANYSVQPGDNFLLVQATAALTVQLPSVKSWMLSPEYIPFTSFDRSIWIKDLTGNASTFNITILPSGTDTIDGFSSFSIITNFELIRLYPISNFQGWFVG